MDFVKEVIYILKAKMEVPNPYEEFHLVWLIATFVIIGVICITRTKHNEKTLKYVLGIYGACALILEILKQLIWSVEIDSVTNVLVWDYQWYIFPFQLCSTPIYICLICMFLEKGKARDAMLSFMAYTTILGSIASAIIPNSLFVEDIVVNIHAMWLHLGSLVVSIYLFMSKEVIPNKKSFLSAIIVFLITIIFASALNILVYNANILNGETFNMFYISPYFESTLPIFCDIYNNVSYGVFLSTYILALCLGSGIIFVLAKILFKDKYLIS